MRSKTLSLRPEYNMIIVRDVTPMKDEDAVDEAAIRSGTKIAAATSEAVLIHSAQRIIPVYLIVKAYSRPRAVDDGAGWEGSFKFDIGFPSGRVHFGDLFHRADSMELPGGPGEYTVAVHYTGREAADQAVTEIYSRPNSEDRDLEIERRAGMERYLVVLSPRASAGHQAGT